MKFEVVRRYDKQVMESTEQWSCIPCRHLRNMVSAGYILLLNGKQTSPAAIEKYVDAQQNNTDIVTKSMKPKVWCVELQREFNTQSEAAKYLNIDPAQVSDSIKTGRKRSGYTFAYKEN